MRVLLTIFVVSIVSTAVSQSKTDQTRGPDCSGGWPTNMTFAHLKNAGLAVNDINFSKTKTTRLASEKTGKDLWHQVYHVTFVRESGGTLEAIAIHDASSEECSMTGVEVFVVSSHLNPDRK